MGRIVSIILFLFYIIVLIVVLTSCDEDFVAINDCVDKSKIVLYKDLTCTLEVEYVCGCNGWMYINKCYAEADGVTNTWSATLKTNCKK